MLQHLDVAFGARRKAEEAAAADREDMAELEAMEARVIRKRGKGPAKNEIGNNPVKR